MCDTCCWSFLKGGRKKTTVKSQSSAPVSSMQEVELGKFILQIETWPTYRIGSSIWPSGFLLAKALAEGAVVFQHPWSSMKVLELGAGPGLPGLAAAKMGARVTLTDYDELVPLMERNIGHNNLEDRARAAALDWSQVAG
eukprot:symbB.v1.2.008038.t1/scaffold490.1/size198488/9